MMTGLAKAKVTVPPPRPGDESGVQWYFDALESQMKTAIRRAENSKDRFRRPGELFPKELQASGTGEFGWVWQMVTSQSRLSLPAAMRSLRDRFLEICTFTFGQRQVRKREHLKRIGWVPKPKLELASFFASEDILLPGMVLPKFPRIRRRRRQVRHAASDGARLRRLMKGLSSEDLRTIGRNN